MPKFSVEVFMQRKCWDHAWVEVEAENAAEAKGAALGLAESGELGNENDWALAENLPSGPTGLYDTGTPEEA